MITSHRILEAPRITQPEVVNIAVYVYLWPALQSLVQATATIIVRPVPRRGLSATDSQARF